MSVHHGSDHQAHNSDITRLKPEIETQPRMRQSTTTTTLQEQEELAGAKKGPGGNSESVAVALTRQDRFGESLAKWIGLRYEEDLRTLMFCAIYFAVVAFQMLVDVTQRWQRVALFWITSFLAFQGAVTVHNAVHCPIFKSTTANRIFQVVISLWFGHCASS